MTISKSTIQWKTVNYLKHGDHYDFSLILNEPLASWDVYDYWEKERVESMQKNLNKGDILFDVGAELGWCNLAYAKIVGPENMVLIEPSPEFWPNIEALWKKNFPGIMPLSCFVGFMSDKNVEGQPIFVHAFPPQSDGELITTSAYRNLNQTNPTIAELTVDEYVRKTGQIPKGLTIDVEGAELMVLQGAKQTLTDWNVKVWVSEHDDF